MRTGILILGLLSLTASFSGAASVRGGTSYYSEGVNLYNAGRFSEATEAFENAVKRKDRPADAQKFIDRIRKETVERIRNRALTGVSKTSWQTKYYFIRAVSGRVRVGISSQEMFERQSVNFRQGAVEAMMMLTDVLQKNDNAAIDLELISEINQDTILNPDLLARQQAVIFSFLSLSTQNLLPQY